jgi:hypothetical protein
MGAQRRNPNLFFSTQASDDQLVLLAQKLQVV